MTRIDRWIRTAAVCSVAAASSFGMGETIYSTNFDSYASGQLFGQDSWDGFLLGTNFVVVPGAGLKSSTAIQVNSGFASSNGWAYRDQRTEGTGTIVTSVNVITVPMGESYSRFGLDVYGVFGPTGADQFGRIAVLTVAGDGAIRFFGNDNTPVPNQSAPSLNWHRLSMAIDFDSGFTSAAVDGVQVDRTLPIPAGKTYLSDADLYVSPVGFDLGTFDNYAIHRFQAGEHVVQTRLAISGIPGSILEGRPITFELVDSQGTVVATKQALLDEMGFAETSFPGIDGTYRLMARSEHSLRRDLGSVTFGSSSAFQYAPPATLINGDIVADNVIDSADYFALSDAYGCALGDPCYTAAADLNGDGNVDSADYFILSDAYGISGD